MIVFKTKSGRQVAVRPEAVMYVCQTSDNTTDIFLRNFPATLEVNMPFDEALALLSGKPKIQDSPQELKRVIYVLPSKDWEELNKITQTLKANSFTLFSKHWFIDENGGAVMLSSVGHCVRLEELLKRMGVSWVKV